MDLDIRISFSVILTLLAIALIFCAVKSFKTHKKIGKAVGLLEIAILPPLIGNLMIIGASIEVRALIGYYIFNIGMDIALMSLINFTNVYCRGIGDGSRQPTVMYILLGANLLQELINSLSGRAFDLEAATVQERDYFRLIPHFWQQLHRVVDYFVFFCVIIMFIIASARTSKLFREKYTVLLGVMLFVGVWQTFYLFSRTPVDRSMIGYGVFGLLVFYFSLFHRPMRLLDRILSGIVSNMKEAMFVHETTGRCIWANKQGLELTGTDLKNIEKANERLTEMFGQKEYIKEGWSEERVLGRGENEKYYTIEHRPINDDKKNIAGSLLIIRDNTEERLEIKREIYNSTHDSLTGLYTRQYLYKCIDNRLKLDPGTEYSAIFVDVKDFKIVNDIFSTDFGDAALKAIAGRIAEDMNDKCVYGRLAGDTFGVFMPSEQFNADKARIERELSDFAVNYGGAQHHLVIHLGVYEVDERDIDVSVMFDRAHLALSTISDDYSNYIAYYDKKLREKVLWEQRITAGLREAIDTMQLRPYLQPINDKNGKVVGAEALARWIHPEHGFMPPAMFIPVFEKNGMITEVDKHMWRCACEILRDWKEKGKDGFISVNISPKDFYFIDVFSEIKGLVEQYGIDPVKLRIEITETVMMNEQDERMKILERFKAHGFIVEMDDFGSGYSSLNLLKEMPVDVLKIDMRFLSSSGDVRRAKTIVKNIIRLSEELNIESLTEGVETQKQYSALSEMGCRLFQGYYFAKPMPREEFEKFAF